jgi:hypothetical protein
MSCDEICDRIAASAAVDGEIERHLASCAACREEAIELRRAATILRAAHVLESTRARRAPLFAARPRRPLRWIAAAAVAAAIVIACVLALRPRAPLAWSGDAQVVALGPGRARLESGRARFESSGAFEIETPLARLSGERAAFTAALVEKGDDVSSKRKIAAGGAAAAALIVAVEWGRVDVQRPGGRVESVAAGEARTIDAPPASREESKASAREATAAIPKTPTSASAVEPAPADGEKRGSVHGTILFDDGAPAANEIVWLWGEPHVVAKTDDHGFFRIDRDWLSSFPRELMVGPEGSGTAAGKVTLVAGVDQEVRLVVPRGIDLDVLVTREDDDEPIAGIWVALRRRDDPLGAGRDSGSAYATTGTDGLVHLRHVHRATYELEIEKQGWRRLRDWIDLSSVALDGPLRVRLHPADPLRVHVDGWPLGTTAEATIRLRPAYASGRIDEERGTVDAAGGMIVDAPSPGTYTAELECDGWRTTGGDVFVVGESGPSDCHVTFPSGDAVSGIVVASPRASSLAGRVRLWPLEGLEKREGRIDAAGNFRVAQVRPARYRVEVDVESQSVVATDEIDVPEGGASAIVVRIGGGSVFGRVVGAPESGLVRASRREGDRWIERGYLRPDVDGAFRGSWLPPGRWRFSATRSGGGYAPPVDADVDLDRETSDVVLRWRPCPEVVIAMKRTDGTVVTGRRTLLVMPNDPGDGWSSTFEIVLDDRGRATVHDVPPGSWKLGVGGSRDVPIEIAEGENPPIELVVP